MAPDNRADGRFTLVAFCLIPLAASLVALRTSPLSAQEGAVTFTRDVAAILYENCVNCHKPGGVAPMSLMTYEEARPYAPLISYRTGLYPNAGTMPPYYIERDVGIQEYRDDERLTEEELATIVAWVDSGAPEGDPEDLPPLPDLTENEGWTVEPDIVVRSTEIFMEAGAPDWWGEIQPIPIPLEEDRYVRAVEIREVNDVPSGGTGRATVGGRFIVHHLTWGAEALDEEGEVVRTSWPIHELGRNPDVFDPAAGLLLRAGSKIVSESMHLHSNGRDTRAHLEIAFDLHPPDYEPEYEQTFVSLGDGQNIDVDGLEAGRELHAYAILQDHTKIQTYEPHLHAAGVRMCLEYIWGTHRETLSCSGYDHNWVKQYTFASGYEPLLPKGAILHLTAWMDTTEESRNVTEPRNWQGSGNASVNNMFIDLGRRLRLTDEQFRDEMAQRVEERNLTRNDQVIGCPLCLAFVSTPAASEVATEAGGGPR